MVRRNSRLIEILYAISLYLPGPACLLGAIVLYVVLYFGPAYINGSHPWLNSWRFAGPHLAPWVAGLVLLIGAAAQIYRRAKAERQQLPSSFEMIRTLSWEDIERRVSDAYRRQGYRVDKYSGNKKDANLVLRRQSEVIFIQCYYWKASEVGIAAVRAFYRIMIKEQATLGIFVTCGQFTPEAEAFAQGKPLVLVKGITLLQRVDQVQQGRRKKRVPQSSKKRPSLEK